MTRARIELVPPGAAGCYHCVQRCVRRAFLCGEDAYTGHSFEHRKVWVEERLHRLGACFAVAIHAYAVMSNHLHVVVQLDPALATSWSDEEVAARWVRLFPPPDDAETAIALKCRQLLDDPERLAVVRTRLGDLSWFMRCLAEPIARRANCEDGCKGRFWEGRFKCQLLCDERALLAAMAYVDLNPIRAGMVEQLDASVHTSAHERIEASRREPATLAAPLHSLIGPLQSVLSLSVADYVQMLDWTGRALAPGKRGTVRGDAPAILSAIDRDPTRWMLRVRAYGSGWSRAAGSAQDLIGLAERIGQRWLKGVRLALRLS